MAAVCVFCGSARTLDARWLELARETGTELARRGHTLVSGGGRVGMMGAVAVAARAGGAHTVGVMPEPLIAREVSDLDADEQVVTRDLATRKTMMIAKSDAFLTLPGGLGTLDELFEVWTLGVLGFHAKPVILVDADGFYAGLVSWLSGLAPARFAAPGALDRLVVVGSVPAAVDTIERLLHGSS
jgi:uncharacterized protein (TIGR00730 family)